MLERGDAHLPERSGETCPQPDFNLEPAVLALCFELTSLGDSMHFWAKKSILLANSKKLEVLGVVYKLKTKT